MGLFDEILTGKKYDKIDDYVAGEWTMHNPSKKGGLSVDTTESLHKKIVDMYNLEPGMSINAYREKVKSILDSSGSRTAGTSLSDAQTTYRRVVEQLKRQNPFADGYLAFDPEGTIETNKIGDLVVIRGNASNMYYKDVAATIIWDPKDSVLKNNAEKISASNPFEYRGIKEIMDHKKITNVLIPEQMQESGKPAIKYIGNPLGGTGRAIAIPSEIFPNEIKLYMQLLTGSMTPTVSEKESK